ncbi:unnamed protein product [Diabrotica balteata]|uniref:Uncharacterized protein n=1 Tax=Diabrotica balteata TaxID=107213 RepID=A0A9N9XFL6_DIABA|nr:unnamed protein product [Diabrotica balteata]
MDEYYDSLDEEEIDSEKEYSLPENEISPEENEVIYADSLEDEPNNVIPFYEGNLCLNQINLTEHHPKSNSTLAVKNNKSKININPANSKKSYLTMFYERNGQTWKNLANVENDASKSFTSCEDPDINYNDIDSMYIKSNSSACSSSRSLKNDNLLVPELSLDSNSRYCQLSESNVHSNRFEQCCFVSVKKPDAKQIECVIPNSKLELWKRRQQYGRKVSETNRIKMNEKKILQNLKRELKNSKICI